MACLSRRLKITAVVLQGLAIGLAGCMNTGDDQPALQSAYPQYQRPATAAYPGGSAPTPGYAQMPVGPANAPGGVRQASYTAPGARFAGQAEPAPGQQQAEIVPDQGPMANVAPGLITAAQNMPPPRELVMAAHPPHRVAAPDILHIEALRLVPKGPYKLEAMEVLSIEVLDALPKKEIKGLFMISPDGKINLGFTYGSVRVAGLTVEEAQRTLQDYLSNIIKGAPTVNVALVQMRGQQNIRGEHLVRPDGTISLGMYGSVFVAGMTLGQVKCEVEKYLAAYLVDPQISVDVFAYNSRKIYIIADGAGYGQQVIVLPATGNETVLDAIGRVNGLPAVASLKKIWVARPSPAGNPCSQVLPVDWKAITQAGRTETNYQLLPGDRIYISADPLITVYNYLDKMIAPVERVMGVILLGTTTVQSFRNNGNNGVVVAR